MIRPAVRHVRSSRMRLGDTRPYSRKDGVALGRSPQHPFRWLPRHGDPYCLAEWLVQRALRALSHPAVYTVTVIGVGIAVQVLTGGGF